MQMNVFITGATGFIGGSIAHRLMQNGHQVTGLVSSFRGKSCRAAQTRDCAGSRHSGRSRSDHQGGSKRQIRSAVICPCLTYGTGKGLHADSNQVPASSQRPKKAVSLATSAEGLTSGRIYLSTMWLTFSCLPWRRPRRPPSSLLRAARPP
jgi:NAD(P)-dependent dehydrogenase (short-subunit alcohol dehydrogenase family)